MNDPEKAPEEADLSSPAQADRTAKTRMCALTRASQPVDRLIRFVAGPLGEVVPDIRNKLPGRGVWIGASREAVDLAVRRKIFARGLKAELVTPPTLSERTEALLRQDALQMLAIANKAGAVVTGFSKVEGIGGQVPALVQAKDGSDSELRRLIGLMRGRGLRRRDPVLVQEFTTHELSLCLGREHVIHAALRAHDASISFLARISRLDDFRAGFPVPDASATGQGSTGALDSPRS
ncbi:Uncharacterized protein YlxR [Rhabdaerophilaceae bacterium]